MDATVRAAELRDLQDLLSLADAFYREDGFATPIEELEANLQVLLRSPTARVAVVDAENVRLAGFAVTTTSFGLENGLIAELEDLYLDPSCRGRGLGNHLLHDSKEWARELGARVLEVVTAPNGRDIRRLRAYYATRGFTDDGRQIASLPLV